MVDFSVEEKLWGHGLRYVAGVDEAGRGPLAGPVVAAAVVLPPDFGVEGIDDSKKLTGAERERLFVEIGRHAIALGVGSVSSADIDRINILQATLLAMSRAIGSMAVKPQHILVDGPRFSGGPIPCTPIIDGDAKCRSIAAASIVAKVTRDRIMQELDLQYPLYGFAVHKGYGTEFHRAALRKYGPSDVHRMSFRLIPEEEPLAETAK